MMHRQAVPAGRPENGRWQSTDFQQLRHQTKNSLQRILCELALSTRLKQSQEGQRLVADLERRICLSAAVSDAIFGLTNDPGDLPERMRTLAESVAELLGGCDQLIRVQVTGTGPCRPELEQTALRIVHEMVGNAVKHGLHDRITGRIVLHLAEDADGFRVTVADDGWGLCWQEHRPAGQGLQLMRDLAARHGGRIALCRQDPWTVAELVFPHPRLG